MFFRSLRFLGYRTFPSDLADDPERMALRLAPLTLVLGKNGSGKTHLLHLVHHLLAALASSGSELLPVATADRRFARSPRDVLHRGDLVSPFDLDMEVAASGCTTRLQVRLRGPGAGEPNALQPIGASYHCDVNGVRLEGPTRGLLPDRPETQPIREAAAHHLAVSEAIGPTRARIDQSFDPPTPDDQHRRLGPDGAQTPARLLADEELFGSVRDWLGGHLPPLRLATRREFDRLALVDLAAGDINLVEAAEGVHQVLPIVTLLRQRALRPTECIDTIEQPELHLHDAAHVGLADLLIDACGLRRRNDGTFAPTGPCMVVETHSEGLILRLRRRVAEGQLRASDVSIVFVESTAGGSTLRSIAIGSDGSVGPWPTGVFTERFAEVQAMRRAAARQESR